LWPSQVKEDTMIFKNTKPTPEMSQLSSSHGVTGGYTEESDKSEVQKLRD